MQPTYRQLEAIVLRLEKAHDELTVAWRDLCNRGLGNGNDFDEPLIHAQDDITASIKMVKDLGENE